MALFVGCSSAFFRVLPCRGCPSLCHFLTVVPSTAQFSSCQCLTRPSVLFPQHHAIGTNSHYQWCRPDGAAFASQAASPPFAERQTADERDADCLPAQQRIATIPNLICMLRLASTPFLGFLVVHAQFSPACLLFVLIAFTDILDGFIARQFPSQRSLLGSFLDPFADKFLISTLFITLTYMQLIAVPVAIIVLGRDLLLVLSSFFLRFKMLEPPLTGRRFFDPTVSAMRIQPTSLSKYNTFFQLTLVTMSLAAPVFNFSGHFALQYLQFFTALTTVVSGLQYALRSGVLRVKDK